ncbi:MAG TPA: DUF1593 domain-containing protein [Lachnospiraceae bacterium]|nr:DUF1593 domain-containing protein [Lachnospiraceae bacterium]
MKIRTIITQDAEVDDQNSLRHFLFYANQVELQGIIQTSSKFHWIGVEGAVRPEKTKANDFEFDDGLPPAPFDKPYRWPGTDWMFRVIDDYEKDYPKLVKHADGYPTPEYLRTITKVGNVGYEGEMEAPSDGSELIRKTILDDDARILYLQVWGGCNTIARALLDIENEYQEKPEWSGLHDRIMNKVVITACGEQDDTFREYIAEEWPGILFVKTLQMQSYAYPWFVMPEGESKDSLKAGFMKAEIINGKSALTDGYSTWLDGHVYEGEGSLGQFGSNPNIVNEWFGARFIKAKPVRYDFLSEGDSPTYFCLLDFGFRTLENFGYGGLAGRYFNENQKNSRGETLHVWNVAKDKYTGRDGNTSEQESMWPYVADIQRDFAARVDWVSKDKKEDAEHMPQLKIEEGLDFTAAPGGNVVLHAKAATEDKTSAAVSFKVYEEASAACAKDVIIRADGDMAEVKVPADAEPGDLIHVVVKAECNGKYRLTYYQQVIITIV